MSIDPRKLKVSELKEELEKRGLDTAGTKPILLKRLQDAIDTQEPATATAPASAGEAASETAVATSPKGKSPKAKSPKAKSPKAKSPAKQNEDGTAADKGEQESSGAGKEGSASNGGSKVINLNASGDLDDLEARKRRAAKFGVALNVSEKDKKANRSKKFGGSAAASPAAGGGPAIVDDETKALREKKFGPVPTKPSTSPANKRKPAVNEDPELIAKRAKKFGLPIKSGSIAVAPAAVDEQELELRKKRAEKFGNPQK